MERKRGRVAINFAILCSTILCSSAVWGASSDSPAADTSTHSTEEITVTARRRTESIQRVPDQITVFTDKQIEQARIQNVAGIAAMTPNLQSFDGFRKGTLTLTARGIPTAPGGEAPVTVLVDGVQVSSLEFVNQDLFDLDNIQVLRGPQGAIYGRGAIGGAILINTKQPSDVLTANAAASWTGGIDEKRVVGSISGPIIEGKLSGRLSGSYTDRRGFLHNSLAGGYCDYSDDKTVRGQLHFTPSDGLKIDAKVNYLDGHSGASCQAMSTDADPFFNSGKNFPNDLPRDFKQYDDRSLLETSVKVEKELSFAQLVSATSYQRSKSSSPGDVDFGPVVQLSTAA